VPDVRYPAIPEPTQDISALLNTVKQLKEAVELMTGQRGSEFSFANQTKTIQRQFGNASAKFTQQINVQASATAALAGQITTIEAKADGASANGQIKFQAKAGPGGSTVSYGLYLTAGDNFSGFEVIADSGGAAAINLSAESLRFSNSGTTEQVFEYDGADDVFRFFVPVELLTEDIGLGQVTNAASGLQLVGAGVSLDVVMTTIAGSSISIIASVWDSDFNSLSAPTTNIPGTLRSFPVSVDGGAPEEFIQAVDTMYFRSSTGLYRTIMNPASLGIRVDDLAAGSHTFRISNTTSFNLRMSLVVLETKR
jgi:hypothetical protein